MFRAYISTILCERYRGSTLSVIWQKGHCSNSRETSGNAQSILHRKYSQNCPAIGRCTGCQKTPSWKGIIKSAEWYVAFFGFFSGRSSGRTSQLMWINVKICEYIWIYVNHTKNTTQSIIRMQTYYFPGGFLGPRWSLLSQICGRRQIQNWPLPLEDIHHQDLQNISVYYICIVILYITILHKFGVNNIPLICRDAFQINFRKINPSDLQVYVDSSQRCLTGLAFDVMINQPPQLPCTTCTTLARLIGRFPWTPEVPGDAIKVAIWCDFVICLLVICRKNKRLIMKFGVLGSYALKESSMKP